MPNRKQANGAHDMLYRIPPNKWRDLPYKDPKTGQTTGTVGQRLDENRANAPKPRDFSALDKAPSNLYGRSKQLET
jgi:hypothetical protein